MGYLCPTRPEIKIGADGGHFSEVPRLREEISTIWLHILRLTNYMSLRSKIEPAAINIERDITKCLTWHGFFWFVGFGEMKPWTPLQIYRWMRWILTPWYPAVLEVGAPAKHLNTNLLGRLRCIRNFLLKKNIYFFKWVVGVVCTICCSNHYYYDVNLIFFN